MYALPDFDSAKNNVKPQDYNRFLQSLELSDLTLETVTSELDRSVSVDVEELQFDVERDLRLRREDVNHPDLLLDYNVKTMAKGQEVVKIAVTFCLHFETKEELPTDFFAIYGSLSADMQAWPFLRELVNSLTSLMGIPRLFLPMLTSPLNIRRPVVSA